MPRVSVLMAHAGPDTFLDRACRSLGAQLYRDFELVVVDDGAGLDWHATLGALRCPWRVLHNPTCRGLAHSMNRAARAAGGVLLARMDSDDASTPARLQQQVAYLEARPRVAFLGSAVSWIDERDRRLGRNYPLTEPDDIAVGLSTYNQMCHGSTLMRREAFEGVGGYDESVEVAQDYDLWLRALKAGHGFANLPEALYEHRLHARSISARRAAVQSDVANRLCAAEPTATWCARVSAWFRAGRDGVLGRPHESLQRGRLALLFLAAIASRQLEAPTRRRLLRFSARHAASAAELLLREVGWRHGTTVKFSHVLRSRR